MNLDAADMYKWVHDLALSLYQYLVNSVEWDSPDKNAGKYTKSS